MNSLSWMLYAADVVGTIKVLTGTIAVIGSFLGGVALCVYASEAGAQAAAPWVKRLLWVVIPAALALALTPSTTTVYAIAASEMGEKVLNTQTGGKAVKALNAWLDRQIDDKGDDK